MGPLLLLGTLIIALLRSVLPKFHQNVSCTTRGHKTLEHVVGYQSESENLRFDQITTTQRAKFHKEAQDNKTTSQICPRYPGATSLKQVHQLAALSSSQH